MATTTIYGPTLTTFHQEQKLRPYYDFMDVDTVRYNIDGEPRPVRLERARAAAGRAAAVARLVGPALPPLHPRLGPRDDAASAEIGDGRRADVRLPQHPDPRPTDPELAAENPAVYYGEGAGSMAYSNVQDVQEHDFPTDERAARRSPTRRTCAAGVEIDSPLKRAVFGWKSRQLVDIFFSDLINDGTRVHYFRTPMERIEARRAVPATRTPIPTPSRGATGSAG